MYIGVGTDKILIGKLQNIDAFPHFNLLYEDVLATIELRTNFNLDFTISQETDKDVF